jgi:hypothetical protein
MRVVPRYKGENDRPSCTLLNDEGTTHVELKKDSCRAVIIDVLGKVFLSAFGCEVVMLIEWK